MPIFEYKCLNCGIIFDELVASSNQSDDTIQCPKCGACQAQRRLSAPAIGNASSAGDSFSGSCSSSGFS